MELFRRRPTTAERLATQKTPRELLDAATQEGLIFPLSRNTISDLQIEQPRIFTVPRHNLTVTVIRNTEDEYNAEIETLAWYKGRLVALAWRVEGNPPEGTPEILLVPLALDKETQRSKGHASLGNRVQRARLYLPLNFWPHSSLKGSAAIDIVEHSIEKGTDSWGVDAWKAFLEQNRRSLPVAGHVAIEESLRKREAKEPVILGLE